MYFGRGDTSMKAHAGETPTANPVIRALSNPGSALSFGKVIDSPASPAQDKMLQMVEKAEVKEVDSMKPKLQRVNLDTDAFESIVNLQNVDTPGDLAFSIKERYILGTRGAEAFQKT
jgi:hypothetical protein